MLVLIGKLYLFVACGVVIAEGVGYLWHRWACHMGIFRKILKDILRRRHFDHHIRYNAKRLCSKRYERSCEIAFHVLGFVVIPTLAIFAFMGWISYIASTGMICGALVFGKCILDGLNTLYHLDEDVVCNMRLFRYKPIWRVYLWLRDYHHIHHIARKNFGILFPIWDIIGGTYVSPSKLPELIKDRRKRENLFPDFDARLSSSCGKPLF